MANAAKMARDSLMLNGNTPKVRTTRSRYDEGLRTQYFADPTRLYADQIGEVASNVYEAQCQGIGSGYWYDWTPLLIRVSPAAIASTGETMPDDWQKLHVLKPLGVDTVPIGAYLTFAGNTWIVYKGRNMGSVMGDGIIRRCNAVINTLDYYGNVVSVPMSYAKIGTLGNASHATENSIVAKNYISCVCQVNEISRNFAENTRLVLGNMAYAMRGVNNFTREFTDDPDSVHLMTLTIERSELLPQDSVEKQCADYGSFSWELHVKSKNVMQTNARQTLSVSSVRNGKTVTSSADHYFSYNYKSSNTNVATVNGFGEVVGVGIGTAEITVTLAQNENISVSTQIQVEGSVLINSFQLFDEPCAELKEYETTLISAGIVTGTGAVDWSGVHFTFSGPPENCYEAVESGFGKCAITCYIPSDIPLTVTVTSDNASGVFTKEIRLIASN